MVCLLPCPQVPRLGGSTARRGATEECTWHVQPNKACWAVCSQALQVSVIKSVLSNDVPSMHRLGVAVPGAQRSYSMSGAISCGLLVGCMHINTWALLRICFQPLQIVKIHTGHWWNMHVRPYATRKKRQTFDMRLSTINDLEKAKLFMKHYMVQCSTCNCKAMYRWFPGVGNTSAGVRRWLGAGRGPTRKSNMLGYCSHVQIESCFRHDTTYYRECQLGLLRAFFFPESWQRHLKKYLFRCPVVLLRVRVRIHFAP